MDGSLVCSATINNDDDDSITLISIFEFVMKIFSDVSIADDDLLLFPLLLG
jgi:hypothetical protein